MSLRASVNYAIEKAKKAKKEEESLQTIESLKQLGVTEAHFMKRETNLQYILPPNRHHQHDSSSEESSSSYSSGDELISYDKALEYINTDNFQRWKFNPKLPDLKPQVGVLKPTRIGKPCKLCQEMKILCLHNNDFVLSAPIIGDEISFTLDGKLLESFNLREYGKKRYVEKKIEGLKKKNPNLQVEIHDALFDDIFIPDKQKLINDVLAYNNSHGINEINFMADDPKWKEISIECGYGAYKKKYYGYYQKQIKNIVQHWKETGLLKFWSIHLVKPQHQFEVVPMFADALPFPIKFYGDVDFGRLAEQCMPYQKLPLNNFLSTNRFQKKNFFKKIK